ncbi:hypothetical protein UFOVP242_41 [uncultured Caudovirales phage]|uniref:Uncharacterized protein n=1 Tax=uncultured Caudovirales phage TaxID=2100421 RepID=A0A6J7WUR2_9CAUD|nr:hypothetical protein UFOVP242_41 [uncultured Caudovirales phage]
MTTLLSASHAQTTYDSKTLVDTNNASTSVSTVNSTNTNNNNNVNINTTTVDSKSVNVNTNINDSKSVSTNTNYQYGTMTNNNNNVSTSTATSTNTNNNNNVSTSTSVSDNKNVNLNTSTSTSLSDNKNVNLNTSTSVSDNKNVNISTSVSDSKQIIDSSNLNTNINKSEITQKVVQPPPTAIAPAMMSGGNSDLCSTGVSGAVQTQIFGVAGGGTTRDLNCERLKLSKTLYDMGMKVAAVATMCQDRRVYDAMIAAGTPCPFEGKIGEQARAAWEANPEKIPELEDHKKDKENAAKNIGLGAIGAYLLHRIF